MFAESTRIGEDLPTCSSNIHMLLEHLVKLVDACAAGLGTDIEKDADIGLDERSKGVEEPSVRVELLLVLPS